MKQDEIKDKVKAIFLELFSELKTGKFDFNKKQSDFRDWDSFGHMRLISMMEEKFKLGLAIEKTIDADSPKKFVKIIAETISNQKPVLVDNQNYEKDFKNFSEALNYWANITPDKPFIVSISDRKNHSYSDFNKLVNSASQFLKKRGLKKGDIVLLCVRNSLEFLVVYFATMRSGGIINLVPSSVGEKELFANIKFLKPKLSFIEKKQSGKISKNSRLFEVEFEGNRQFLKILEPFPNDGFVADIKENDATCLYYSSGTTAKPKGILFSHKGIINMALLLSREFNHNNSSIHLGILPMGHTSVMHHSLLPVLYMGGTFVFSENFIQIRKDFWGIIKDYNINYVQTVPTVVFMILNTAYPNYQRKKLILPYVACGSAPLSQALKESFEKKFKIKIANLYGLSEAGHMIDDYPFKGKWKVGLIGRPMKDVDVRIFDDKGKEVKTGMTGEFSVKTPSIFMGYYKDEKLTKFSFKKGYFCTGDLGYKDKNGLFYYVGRKKDLIIKGGVNISPNLIDEILVKHPKISESASVGKDDKFFGEVIKSFVVLKSGQTLSKDKLFSYCKKKLGDFKSPSEIEFVKVIPKTFSGKVLRRNLRKDHS